MPSSYTYKILEDPKYTFEKFKQQCIRAFGAAIDFKDESLATTPDYDKVVGRSTIDYHTDALKQATIELAEFKVLDNVSKMREFQYYVEGQIKSYKKQIKKKQGEKLRLDKFLEQAEKWNAPTPDHDNFKDFMVCQLKGTIEQCNVSYYEKALTDTKQETFAEWSKGRMESLKESITYHIKHLQEAKDNREEKLAWLKPLLGEGK